MIECDLLPIPEYGNHTVSHNQKEKRGRYHGSVFPGVKSFGTKKWVVATYIELKDESILDKMELQDIIDGCFESLNKAPPRKKYAKKDPQPKYGVITPHRVSIVTKGSKRLLSALIITDKKKSKFFWGKGKSV